MPTVTCTKCGQPLPQIQSGERLPCPRCGTSACTVHKELTAQLNFSGGLRGIAFAFSSKSKWFAKFMSERVWQYPRKVWGHRFKMEDKRNDHYFERVVHSQTGEVLHLCDERLTEHRGHGSAKKQGDATGCT